MSVFVTIPVSLPAREKSICRTFYSTGFGVSSSHSGEVRRGSHHFLEHAHDELERDFFAKLENRLVEDV